MSSKNSKVLSIRLAEELHKKAIEASKDQNIKLAEFIRQSITYSCSQTDYKPTTPDYKSTTENLVWHKEQIAEKDKQIATKDEQIANLQKSTEGLQQSLDQAQQLHAMSEQRHQAELAKIENRGFIQRLRAVFSG
mgnify:CR=1 FL=1